MKISRIKARSNPSKRARANTSNLFVMSTKISTATTSCSCSCLFALDRLIWIRLCMCVLTCQHCNAGRRSLRNIRRVNKRIKHPLKVFDFFLLQFFVVARSNCRPDESERLLGPSGSSRRHHRWRTRLSTWWRWPHRRSPSMDKRNSVTRVSSTHQTAFSSSRTHSRITRSRPPTKR